MGTEACKGNDSMRKVLFSLAAGILSAFCYVAGYQLDNFDALDLTDKNFYVKWAAAAAGISVLLFFLWKVLDRISESYTERVGVKEAKAEKQRRVGRRLLCTAILVLCWLPALFSVFPGVFSYDAYDEWEQVHNWMLTAHHPVAHVLLLGGLTEGFFLLTGSYNVGIGVYTVLQMFLFALAVSAVIDFMAEFKIPRFWRVLSMVFYAASPVTQLFSICATKDVLFSGAELFFFLYAIRFSINRELAGDRKKVLMFGMSALCTMIFRNNGLYIVILTLLALAAATRRDWMKYRKNLVMFLAVIIVPYFLYTGPIYGALGVKKGGVEEMLSVPLQQMARVYRYDAASMSGEELDTLFRFVGQDALEQYRPTVSDFVKQGFHREEFQGNSEDFFCLWLKLGVKHPLTYVNSFLINTVDAWYPHALIDGYRHADGRGSWFDYRVAPPGEERVYLRGLHEFYEELSHDLQMQKKPFAFMLLSPGWYFLCTMVLFFYFWSRRKYKLMLPFWVFVFHILTVLLGPMILVRYMLLFFIAFPVVCAMALFPKGFEQGREDWMPVGAGRGDHDGEIQDSSCGG